MGIVSGGGGAAFNGGTITAPLVIAPTDPTVIAGRITLPTGAEANFTDVFNIVNEHGAFILETDATGFFIWKMATADGSFTVRDYNADYLLRLSDSGNNTFYATTAGTASVVSQDGSQGLTVSAAGAQFDGKLGFFSHAPVVKPTVAGAKLPSDVVLASLLTALVGLGLVVDNST